MARHAGDTARCSTGSSCGSTRLRPPACWSRPVLLAPARASRAGFTGAGVAIAFGVLFREEVAAALPALLLARAACRSVSAFADLLRAGRSGASWAAVAIFLASVPMNLVIYGAPLPMHVTQDAWEVARNTPYLQVRRDVIVDLLLPVSAPPCSSSPSWPAAPVR